MRRERHEGPDWLRVGSRYVAPLLVPQLPPSVAFGFLGRISPTSAPVELFVEAHPIVREQALELLHGARAVATVGLAGGGDGALGAAELDSERTSAEELEGRVARREQEIWRVGIRFATSGATPAAARRRAEALGRRLGALGFRPRVPLYRAETAVRGPDPEGRERRPPGYYHTLSTDGVAAFYPFADEAVLDPAGVLVGLLLDDGAPVFVDRWSRPSHSWGVFGMTGSGKTFATALTVLRTRWMRGESDVVILDPLGEFAGLARALGGTVLSVGREDGGRLNPLDPASAGGDRSEKAARVAAVLRALFPSLKDEEAAALDTAISRLYAEGPEVPTFSDLARAAEGLADGGRLGRLLDPLINGSLRRVNGPTTIGAAPGPVAVDLRGVAEDHLPFHLAYLLDWAYGRLREGTGAKLLVIDEAHLLVRHGATAEFLDRMVRHVRHFHAGVVVLSQHPEDFLRLPSGRSLLGNLSATLLFRLSAVGEEVGRFFDLTPAEIDWLPRARLPREAGYSEALLRLGDLHLPLAVIAATPEYQFLTGALGGNGEAKAAGGAAAPPRL